YRWHGLYGYVSKAAIHRGDDGVRRCRKGGGVSRCHGRNQGERVNRGVDVYIPHVGTSWRWRWRLNLGEDEEFQLIGREGGGGGGFAGVREDEVDGGDAGVAAVVDVDLAGGGNRVGDDHQVAIVRDGEHFAAQGNVAGGRGVGDQGNGGAAGGDIHVHQALIAAEVDAPRRQMIKHHGIGSAGYAYDGADGGGSRGHREHRAAAAGLVLAVGGRGPGGVGGRLGGRSYVNGDRAIALRPVRQQSVAGVDGECG